MGSPTNNNQLLDAAVESAIEAGGILRSEFDRPVQISPKGELDMVTQADRHSEKVILARLQKYFPTHAILSEEGGGQDGDGRHRWIVDPLDGTTNFAHGYPCFAVSIGFEEAGELRLGVIYQPITNELFTCARGHGAYLNGRRIQVSRVNHLSSSLLATGFPSRKRTRNPNILYYWNFTLRSHGIRRDGSSALDLASVACGRFEGFFEFGLHPWDAAAGVLLVREAGGTVTNLSGQAYRLGEYELLASNGHIHEEMLRVSSSVPVQLGDSTDERLEPGTREQ